MRTTVQYHARRSLTSRLPAQPAWLLRLPEIREAVARLSAPVLDRAAVEELFGIRRRRAIELMHRFGGYQAGRTFLVDRLALLRQLDALLDGDDFRVERARRRRLAEDLQSRAIPIPRPRSGPDLPGGVRLRPGELRIEFRGTEELLQRLFELALAIRNDYDRFDAIASSDAADR